MMKMNKKTIRSAMDNRLSFLDELPSCRAAVQYRIAQEEKPVMKKKMSFALVFAIVLVLLTAAALATGLLLSPRADAVRTADRALEDRYGLTAEMQTLFARQHEELPDDSVRVTYSGAGNLETVLGTYTVVVRDGRAEACWSLDGVDTAGGYDAEAWGTEQLKDMIKDSQDASLKQAYMDRADAIAEARDAAPEDDTPSEADEGYEERIEAEKTAAMEARKLSEDEMIAIGREFIISNYDLNEEQVGRLELYTNSDPEFGDLIGAGPEDTEANKWYVVVNGRPCFQVEYLLYQPLTVEQEENGEQREYTEKDGYYNVFVNVETGEIEEYEYNSALGGLG